MKIKSVFQIGLTLCLVVSLFGTMFANKAQAADGLPFSDISNNYWAKDTIQWGYEAGLVNGYKDGQFKPNKTVSEAEFLAMLIRTFEPEVTSSKTGNWTNPYYVRAKALNYPVSSYTNASTRNQILTRTQVAELISSAEGVNYSGNNAIQYMLALGLANGSDASQVSIASFKGSKALTRAEALQFIKNFADYGVGGLLDRPTEPSNPADLPALPTAN
ncbi:S-layer homology domain-containing protein [Paenibacillus kyungheensis]